MAMRPVYYINPPKVCDICSKPIEEVMYDCRLATGTAWANIGPCCYPMYGATPLGQGQGQKYRKQDDGRFLKVEG